jgi:hypothetical protein
MLGYFLAKGFQMARDRQHQIFALPHDAPDAIRGGIKIERVRSIGHQQRRFDNLDIAGRAAAADQHLQSFGAAFRGQVWRREKPLHAAEGFLRGSDETNADATVSFRAHLRGVQIHKSLPDLP